MCCSQDVIYTETFRVAKFSDYALRFPNSGAHTYIFMAQHSKMEYNMLVV